MSNFFSISLVVSPSRSAAMSWSGARSPLRAAVSDFHFSASACCSKADSMATDPAESRRHGSAPRPSSWSTAVSAAILCAHASGGPAPWLIPQ